LSFGLKKGVVRLTLLSLNAVYGSLQLPVEKHEGCALFKTALLCGAQRPHATAGYTIPI